MKYVTIALLALSGVALSGCAGFADRGADASREYSAAAMVEYYAGRCRLLSLDARMKDWAAMQIGFDKLPDRPVAPIFDCNKDGVPDFTVQQVIDAGYYKPPGN